MRSLNRSYISQVDELRALAALLVFFFHVSIKGFITSGGTGWPSASNAVEAVLFEGHTGVSLFIFLSGFILALGVQDRPIKYGAFLTNRVLRIFPLMVLLSVTAIYANKNVTLEHAFAPFLLVQNALQMSLSDNTNLTGTLWTVSVEFQIYLVAPFLFRFLKERGVVAYAIPLVLLIIVLRCFALFSLRNDVEMLWAFPYTSIIGRFNQFLLGAAIATNWKIIGAFFGHGKRAYFLGFAGLLSITLLCLVLNAEGGGEHVWRWWRVVQMDIEAMAWACFAVGYIIANPLAKIPLLQGVLRSMGIVSFSFYLFQWPVINDVLSALPLFGIPAPIHLRSYMLIGVFIMLPATLAVSGLSYFTIEKPFLNMRSKYLPSNNALRRVV